ncbi:MAG: efflux RND transporter permease subunit [Bacteroidaceae bacterium]|nr:efflux RND transporter permease subunit [Bacteroidaceae bacterium]
MKKLVSWAVRNPVTVTMAVLAILLLGKISYDRLSVELLPSMNSPRLFVEIDAGERPPEEIEKQFVRSMESQIARQSDVRNVSSVVKVGTARLTVEYAWRKNMDEAFLDLEKAMSSFSQDSRITDLRISQKDPTTAPIMIIGFSNPDITDMAELRKVADSYVCNELMRVEGVADVSLAGDEFTNLVIEADPYKLQAFGITVENISSRIQENNQRVSGGRITEQGAQYLVTGSNTLTDEIAFGNIIVGYKNTEAAQQGARLGEFESASMAPIYLRDVAKIHFENREPENIVRVNGKRSIGISVFKEMDFNTVKAVEGIKSSLGKIQKSLPGYEFRIISDQATFINSSIGEVKNSALLGVLLAVIVLFVFLRRVGTTLIVAVSIPVSIIATFNLMFFSGLTINILTLGGLALGAGMLVDNAIVVIESIFRNQERGLSVRDAAITGTSEVGGAVSASTLTTIVVFLPIVYLHGATGELFKDEAWTVTFSLLSSLFVAILVIPTLYERIFSRKKVAPLQNFSSVNIKGYAAFLKRLVEKRWWVILGSLILVGVTILLLPYVGTEFMPKTDANTINVKIRMAEGTSLDRTSSTVENLENLVFDLTEDPECVIYTHVGPGASAQNMDFEGENTATMKIQLSKASAVTPDYLTEVLASYINGVEGMELSFTQDDNSLGSMMGTEDAPLVVEIKGEELDLLAALTEQVKAAVDSIDCLYNVESSLAGGAPEIIITVDRALAGMNNINVSTIITQIQQHLDGRSAGQMDYKGDMRDISIKVPGVSLADLNTMVITSGQKDFRLIELAQISESTAPKEISRLNQNRVTRVTADIDESVSLDKAAQRTREAVRGIELPQNYSINVTGEEERRAESMNSLLLALVLSIVLVYMVMASQFESLLHPFTILLTIPLALVGAVLMFLITGITVNIMGIIGMVMLAGIAVNNSIILVDRIGQLKESGLNLTDAIAEAGQQRIRPILMTSLTTILALVPMALGLGDGASLSSPMAIAVIGGLFTSTLLSLVVIPCVYYVFESAKIRITGK